MGAEAHIPLYRQLEPMGLSWSEELFKEDCMEHQVTAFEAGLAVFILLGQFLTWVYFREGGISDWWQYRKFLRKIKEGKSFKLDVAQP